MQQSDGDSASQEPRQSEHSARRTAAKEAILAKLLKQQRRVQEGLLSGELWEEGDDGRIAVRIRTDLVHRSWREFDHSQSRSRLGEILHTRFGYSAPIRTKRDQVSTTGGFSALGSELNPYRWTPGSFKNYLEGKELTPTLKQAERIYQTTVRMISDAFSEGQDGRKSLLDELEPVETSLRGMLDVLFSFMGSPNVKIWRPAVSFEPLVVGSLDLPPKFLDRAEAGGVLEGLAETAGAHLREQAGRRAVLVAGAAHSGKKTILRLLIASTDVRGWFVLNDGTRLPILALAIDEHTTDELIELIFKFYKAADDVPTWEDLRGSSMSTWNKVRLIEQMTLRTPACVLLSGVEPIDDDEVIRSLRGGEVDAVIIALLRGHTNTRLIFAKSGPGDRFNRQVDAFCKTIKLPVPNKISRKDLKELPPYLSSVLPPKFSATGVCWVLACSLLELAASHGKAGPGLACLQREAEVALVQANPSMLVRLIFSQVLSELEQVLVGIISSSLDGIRLSVLVRLVGALDGIAPGRRSTRLSSSNECEEALQALGLLLNRREMRVEPALVFHGEPEREPIFVVDDGWRRHFEAEWRRSDAESARLSVWLVSREAIRQARWIRVFEAGNRSVELKGRDVQALHALIASVDPSTVSAAVTTEAPVPFLEDAVVPPFNSVSRPANAGLTLRFALLQLYREDLEGRSFRLLTFFEDARVRLGVLLAFFMPETPWLKLDERKLRPSWSHYAHIRNAFLPDEVMAMLTSIAMAAQRLQRFDLVSAAARLGEEVVQTEDWARIPPIEFMRLLRAEIDCGLLLGGNPDALLPTGDGSRTSSGVQLADVARQIESVLGRWFPRPAADEVVGRRADEQLIARGKLLTRLGEVFHAEGRFSKARKAFDDALVIELDLLGNRPSGRSLAPIFGGRGARSVLRFSIDAFCRRRWRDGWTMFHFRDGLKLPEPRKADQTDVAIQRAIVLHEQNVRRLSRGRAVDAVGIKIDAARIAATRHDYRRVFQLLDQAFNMHRDVDPHLETLLERAAVRVRFTLDATTLCLRRNAEDAVFTSEEMLQNLRSYLGMPDATALELARNMLVSADDERVKLDALCASLHSVGHPYAIYSRYLHGLSEAIQSRLDLSEVVYRERLLRTLDLIEASRAQMVSSNFTIYLAEATVVAQSVRDALSVTWSDFEVPGPGLPLNPGSE